MALPTSTTWNLADFNESTIGGLLALGPGDLTITPSVAPYFGYNPGFTVLTADSRDGAVAMLDFNVGIPARFTVEFEARFPSLPSNLGDLSRRKLGVTVADDAGRGISIYFATTGLAVARVDDFGSVSALPDTANTVQEIAADFRTVRVAVDSALGRAYVFVSSSSGGALELRYIIPVEQTPPSVVDRFQVFAHGTVAEPASIQLRALRLAGDLVIPNYPPTANAGPDRVAPVGQSVRFDGRASYDVEGAPLTYSWRVVDAPFGSQYAAEGSSGSTVDDGDADGSTNTLSFTPGSLPAWVSVGDVLLVAGTRHVIATVNNVGGSLTVTTESIPDNLSSRPFRIIRQSLLVDANTETPYALPDVQGIYRFELTVNDGQSDSEPAEVLANIVGARMPFGVEPDVAFLWRALGDEWRFVEGKEVFQEIWCGVAQIISGKLLEAWQYHYNYSIRDAQRTFQRKWLAYRTLITETSPNTVTLSVRHGLLRASHEFELGLPAVVGSTLVFEYVTGDTATSTATTTVTLTGNALSQIVADINSGLSGTGIIAYAYAERREDNLYRMDGTGGSTVDDGDGDGFTATFSFPPATLEAWVAAGDTLIISGKRYTINTVNNPGGVLTVTAEEIPDNLSGASFRIYRMVRLGIKSSVRAFKVLSSSTAALGVPSDQYNYLTGTTGALATNLTYYAGDGVTLSDYGVSRYDLLVVNGGQSLNIDRITTDPLDPLPGMRVVCFDTVPVDVTSEWSIPSVFRSSVVDYEYSGSYPGDLFKGESYDTDNDTVTDVSGYVVAQRGKQLAVNLNTFLGSTLDLTRYEVRVLGVKRRKGIPLAADVLSIPRLQDKIPAGQTPTLWKENADYILEPFYRDTTGAPLPYLQFRDSVFIDPDLEPPDLFWAELTVFSNDQNVEDLFGRLSGFLRDDASNLPPDFNYVAGVAGLMYAQQRGPSVFSVGVGAQILLGQPFAEVDGVIEDIRNDFSPLQGRILIRDADGNTPTRSEIVRTYYYKKNPLDLSAASGLDVNPATQLPWAEGDTIKQFQPIGAGVDIVDLYNTPDWYIPYVKGGLITEIEKFHYFLVRFNLDLVTLSNLSLLFQFITNVKPTYTHPLLVGLRAHEEDLDVVDEFDMTLYMNLYESTCSVGRAFMYDDYRGDGTMWTHFDGVGPPWAPVPDPGGVAFFDGLVDCPTDIVELCLEIVWAGGIITYDSIFFLDTDVIDVSGTMGPPGSTFTPTYDMLLPAGTYRVCIYTKDGHIVLPPPPP